jgi:hypothetical protein
MASSPCDFFSSSDMGYSLVALRVLWIAGRSTTHLLCEENDAAMDVVSHYYNRRMLHSAPYHNAKKAAREAENGTERTLRKWHQRQFVKFGNKTDHVA